MQVDLYTGLWVVVFCKVNGDNVGLYVSCAGADDVAWTWPFFSHNVQPLVSHSACSRSYAELVSCVSLFVARQPFRSIIVKLLQHNQDKFLTAVVRSLPSSRETFIHEKCTLTVLQPIQ